MKAEIKKKWFLLVGISTIGNRFDSAWLTPPGGGGGG